MTVDGEQASWEHVVLSLIDETGLSNCTLNMEEEKSQKIEVTFSATHDAEVMIVFSDGTSKHPSAGWELAADNVPAFLMDYEASMGEVSLSNNSDTYTGNDSIEGSFGFGVFQSDSSLLSMDMINIDSTHIAELWVYYRGKGVEPSCSVLNQQVAGTLTLKEICLGRCGLPDPGDGEAPFDTYPNPSSGVVFFSEEQDAVELLSASGVVISSHQHVSSIDLSPLSKGLYILSTYYGFKKIVRK